MAVALFVLVAGCSSGAAEDGARDASSPPASPKINKAALIAEAEKAVEDELPDVPLWKGTTFKGNFVSESEVCVDRTYPPGGGLDGNGGSAGYVVVTFPGPKTGEPQDGKCRNTTSKTESKRQNEPVEVPAAFQNDPGLVTRDDLGDKWPLTVDFGALDCREAVVDGMTLQSVTFRVPHMQYAVNGTAKSHTGFPDINEIWADDPDVKGLKIDISPLIDRGLARC